MQFSDLDPAAIEDFRRRWIDKARRAEDLALADRLAAQSAEELLQDAEAVTEGQFTYAALILFGTPKAVGRHLAQAEVVFEYRSSEAAGPAQDRIDFRRGFFAFHDELWNRINLRNDKQDFQDGLFVHPIPTFTERAVREAILNAVSHRDYQLGGSTFVRQYARRLEIDSPGGLPYGITLQNILDRQNPRNRRIAEIFARCGLVERAGQGMNLIFEESLRTGKPVPDFSRTDKYQVGLTLLGNLQNPQFVRFVEEVSKKTRVVFSTRDWWLMSLVAIGERIPKQLRSRADRLLDLGLIERVRGRGFMLSRRYYEFVGETATYTRKRGLDREQNLALLLNHIQANAETGCKLDELCEVLPALPESHVRSLLRTLRRRGQIYSVGATRGTLWFPASAPASSVAD